MQCGSAKYVPFLFGLLALDGVLLLYTVNHPSWHSTEASQPLTALLAAAQPTEPPKGRSPAPRPTPEGRRSAAGGAPAAAAAAAAGRPQGGGPSEGRPRKVLRAPPWSKQAGRGGPRCLWRAVASSRWQQVSPSDLKSMEAFAGPPGAEDCRRQGRALVYRLDLKRAKHVKGHAFELPFPDYVVADEPGGWRERRSTLQLFALGLRGAGGPQPMGPSHSAHEFIETRGSGAYSHWREPITAGPYVSSKIRFSTPGNVPSAKLKGIMAVVFPMAPPMGWIEFAKAKKKKHQEVFRELFFLTFPTLAAEPHVVENPEQARNGTWYLWRIGGNHEFELPLGPGELYEKRLPYQIAEHYGQFERRGAVLFPPAATYVYYQNKVGLAELFQRTGVKTPRTWVFRDLQAALAAKSEIAFPVVVKDPYGFSSHGIQQAANVEEYVDVVKRYFADTLQGVEALVQSKVVALREARVTYVDGRPFHGYWRIRKSLQSASAASNMGGYQDFSFPLADIAPFIARFAQRSGVPVGGVDLIWQDAEADVKQEPYALEVSPTSDINPPAPSSWKKTYAEFKKTPGYRDMYLGVRRRWAEQMAIAVIDRHRRSLRHLFVDIDNVVSRSAVRVRKWKGQKDAYKAAEVVKDEPVEDAVAALKELSHHFFVRFLTARGQYEDPFNVTQHWLDAKGFEYDELLVVHDARSKVAHLTSESLLVDDFTVGHEEAVPRPNDKFKEELRAAHLPFVVFPFGGLWADVMPQLLREAQSWNPSA